MTMTPQQKQRQCDDSDGFEVGADDPLDEWYLDRELEYWPNLPPRMLVETETKNENDNVAAARIQNNDNNNSNNPFALVQADLDWFHENLHRHVLPLENEILNKAASHVLTSGGGGKKIRFLMILLLSRALMANEEEKEECLSSFPNDSSSQQQEQEQQQNGLLQAQRRLALAVEAAHNATLLHDDVLDDAETRRGGPAAHRVFGAKTAVLAGDCLLAKMYMILASLNNVRVITAMSTVLGHLASGEVMQFEETTTTTTTTTTNNNDSRLQAYLVKTFHKTASLMAYSCKSAALLGEYYPQHIVDAAYRYGKHIGMAFQLTDDALDFDGEASILGKPVHADLEAGTMTAPVFFASRTCPELKCLMERTFCEPGDVDRAYELVLQSSGVDETKRLARVHAELAINAAMELGKSKYRDALVKLAYMTVKRKM